MFKPFLVVGIVFVPAISYCTICGGLVVTSMQKEHELMVWHGPVVPSGVSPT